MNKSVDVVLVGAGIMSATLATLLKQLNPDLSITLIEQLDEVAGESSDGWNNAGTGHAAYCELNYTPEDEQGNVDVSKAFTINEAFETSLQFWSYLVKEQVLPSPKKFINTAPHLSFVWGEDNVAFLRKRFELMSAHPMFKEMEYSEDPAVLSKWMPLVMEGREPGEKIAGTRINHGSDVDFGALTRLMIDNLLKQPGFELLLSTSVQDLRKRKSGKWSIEIENEANGEEEEIVGRFVFLGAGGGALPLLQKADIPEAAGYGGFPVSGQWLVCDKPEIVEQHHAKVYGKAAIGAPPMSVPHLDTRIISGKKALLFGPFAGFTTKFLKKGSYMDLPSSVKLGNLMPIVKVGLNNMDLTRYLIGEVMQSQDDRIDSLRQYFPNANKADWRMANAGKRVQIIKKDEDGGGKLEFGTEVIVAGDASLAALLGASPGASTSVPAMVGIMEQCFPDLLRQQDAQQKMSEMFPAYGQSLQDNAELLREIRSFTLSTLELA